MGLIKTLLPTPGKIIFMLLLLPLVLLLTLVVFSLVAALTTFSLFAVLIIAITISYLMVSIVYQLFKKALKILIPVAIVALILFYAGFSVNSTKMLVNNALNNNFHTPETACVADTDCAAVEADCSTCPEAIAASGNWNAWCPFNVTATELCESWPAHNATCVNGQCALAPATE